MRTTKIANTTKTTEASQAILVALLVLSSIGLTGILSRFDGLILVKVGIEGGQILIDGRQESNSLKDLPVIPPSLEP
jgi:hypothetical protein